MTMIAGGGAASLSGQSDALAAGGKLEWKAFPAGESGFFRAPVLVWGAKEALLIDGGFTLPDGRALAEAVKATGRKLTAVYVSQSDPDYYFSLGPISAAFPDARVIAASDTIAAIRASVEKKLATWGPQLGDNGPKTLADVVMPTAFDGDHLTVDGQAIQIVPAQSLANRRYLWAPSLSAILGGVLVFSGVHVWTADTADTAGAEARAAWVRQLDAMLARKPAVVVPGHMTPSAATGLIANMSHEIRTPLTAIVGYADRLAMRVDLDAAARREVMRVDTAAQALLAIVNDVLDFSKLEAGHVVINRKPVDPAALVVEAVGLFEQQAGAKNLGVAFEARPDLPSCLLIDPDRVRQVLLNLIGNAVKFTEAGSVRVVVGYDAGAARLQVDVEDSGPGVTAAQHELLFRRFSQIDASATRRYGGTGLGLAICKGLVEAMQGEIGVRAREGGGSIFHISVPAHRTLVPVSLDRPRDEVRLDGMRVLVVDDDEVNRELVRSILAPLGAEVVEAPGGREGVAVAAAAAFDAILMDLRMPHLDGYAATKKIRASGASRDTPIVAFSASLESPSSRPGGGGEPAFSGFLRKPFAPRDLVAAMQNCLEQLRTA